MLDELDVFAKRPKQTLLYNLLDALHRSNMQARFLYHIPLFDRVLTGACIKVTNSCWGMLNQVLVDLSCLAQAL